jgi:hypothetical protein
LIDSIDLFIQEKYEVKETGQFDIVMSNIHSNIDQIEEMIYKEISNELYNKDEELKFDLKELIYIPKWYIIFQEKNNKFYYKIAWAYSENMYLTNELQPCPKDLMYTDKGKTFSICELCSISYCDKHSFILGDHSYCNYHSSSQIKGHQKTQLYK